MTRRRTPAAVRLALALACSQAALEAQAPSEETIQFFKQNCQSCHTIGGGRLTGPDLKDVTQRKDRAWLVRFIRDPKGVIDSGDPYAQKLLREAGGSVMNAIPNLDEARAHKLLDLIEAESLLERSQFAGLQISDRPLTPEDVLVGEALFLGERSFGKGAPACIACHTTSALGSLGGGTLGPDLSTVYARLEGRKSLAAWLSSPPSAVMQPVFRDHELEGEEILALVAYLEDVTKNGASEAEPQGLHFFLAGLVGAAAILLAFDVLWRHRFRAVRRPMIERTPS